MIEETGKCVKIMSKEKDEMQRDKKRSSGRKKKRGVR